MKTLGSHLMCWDDYDKTNRAGQESVITININSIKVIIKVMFIIKCLTCFGNLRCSHRKSEKDLIANAVWGQFLSMYVCI